MSTHGVAELYLQIRAGAGSAPDLRPRAERFARAVLERCADLLERAPGRMLLVRRLPLRWRLSEAALGGRAALECCAAAAAAAIEEAARQAETPSPDDDVAVFDDEAHWRACQLREGLDGRAGAWYYSSLKGEGDPVETLCAPERRDLALGVLARLAADGRLIELLAALPPGRTAMLAQALGAFSSRTERRSPGAEPVGATELAVWTTAASVPVQLAEFARSLPVTLPAPAIFLALYVQARTILGPATADESIRAAVETFFTASQRSHLETSALPGQRGAAPPVPPESPVCPVPIDLPGEEPPAIVPVEAPAGSEHLTEFGGLFYLLTCALELDLGEALWKACLPEGDVLAYVAAAVLGPGAENDPAPFLFGGVEPGRPFPTVTVEQQQELAAALVAALAAALPRRGLAELPEIVLDLISRASGRLLVAAAPESPFALFAWPAPSPQAAGLGLRTFLSGWPSNAPPLLARPALAELDGTSRLRPSRDARVSRSILIPEGTSPEGVALLAQAAGALCGLFAARVGALAWPDAAALVQRYLALPGRVSVTGEELTVALTAESIDLGVRRAGLDRNPGWVPWLRRKVQLYFGGRGREADS